MTPTFRLQPGSLEAMARRDWREMMARVERGDYPGYEELAALYARYGGEVPADVPGARAYIAAELARAVQRRRGRPRGIPRTDPPKEMRAWIRLHYDLELARLERTYSMDDIDDIELARKKGINSAADVRRGAVGKRDIERGRTAEEQAYRNVAHSLKLGEGLEGYDLVKRVVNETPPSILRVRS